MAEDVTTKESQLVRFTFPEGKEYEGAVKQIGENNFELSVDDLPEEAWLVIERLEAQAKKEEDKYIFLDVYFRGRSSHTGRINSGSTTIFSPTTTFHTNEPENPLSQEVMSLSASVDNLDLWFNKSLFTFHNPMHMSDTLEYSMQDDVGQYDFKGFKLKFSLSIAGMTFWRFTREVNLRQAAHIELHTGDDTNISYLKLVDALRSIERFLGLAFRAPIQTVEVDVTSKDFGLTIGGETVPNIFPAYGITLSDVRAATPFVKLTDELAFTYDQFSDFQVLLDKWAAIEEQISPIVDLFLSSVSGGSTVLENIFLNRIQGIEAFHRSFRPGTLLTQEEYDKQKDEIIKPFTGANKKLLKKVLKHGNDLSLEQRMRVLDTELKLKGIPTIMACDFDVVANTRNYFSHYSSDITNICPTEKLMQLTHEVGQMLFALILSELGISSDIVSKAVRRIGTV